jgi:hypothetical protein
MSRTVDDWWAGGVRQEPFDSDHMPMVADGARPRRRVGEILIGIAVVVLDGGRFGFEHTE